MVASINDLIRISDEDATQRFVFTPLSGANEPYDYMNTAVITIKTDPAVKSKAQKVVEELGLSLSAVINGYLRQLIRTKSVSFNARPEIPNAYMRKALKESEADVKAGRVVSFLNGNETLKYLDDMIVHGKKSKKY